MPHSSERVIKHKPGLLNLAGGPGNVPRACKVMGLSGDMFHRCQKPSRKVVSRLCCRRPHPKKPVAPAVEEAVV